VASCNCRKAKGFIHAKPSESRSNFILNRLPEEERIAIGYKARQRILRGHTAKHRAAQLQDYLSDTMNGMARVFVKTASTLQSVRQSATFSQ
jgi:glycosyl transferase family 1